MMGYVEPKEEGARHACHVSGVSRFLRLCFYRSRVDDATWRCSGKGDPTQLNSAYEASSTHFNSMTILDVSHISFRSNSSGRTFTSPKVFFA